MPKSKLQSHPIGRRQFIALGAASVGALALRPAAARELGDPRRSYGERSPFETSARTFGASVTPGTGSSRAPLQDLYGTITPSALHFERHHSGVPKINSTTHELLLDGLVERPLVFTLKNLRRFPSVSRVHFIECAGNSGREHEGRPGETVQRSHGLFSNSEWTGVPLKNVLKEVGIKPKARWIVAEGADASRMSRSIPLDKALDDVLLAYGQNGEALRPEQGYPVRLFLPGVEGNASIKWLRRIELADQPFMTREETSKYTDPLPDGTARMFSLDMDAKSLITEPSFPDKLSGPGWWEIRGIAWTGRGKITRVEISTDGGKSWQNARLDEPVLPKCHTRFRFPFEWKGNETIIASRATDESGYVQPTYDVLLKARGPNTAYHFNNIRAWKIHADGTVKFEAGL